MHQRMLRSNCKILNTKQSIRPASKDFYLLHIFRNISILQVDAWVRKIPKVAHATTPSSSYHLEPKLCSSGLSNPVTLHLLNTVRPMFQHIQVVQQVLKPMY